jgi:hypothetical protein
VRVLRFLMELVRGPRPNMGRQVPKKTFLGGAAMKQCETKLTQATATQQQPLPLREVGVPELIARAWKVRQKMLEKGKTSRRVSFPLPAHLLPPRNGDYSTSMGIVRIRTAFRTDEARWWVTVVFPEEGFKVKDFLGPSSPPASPDTSAS